MNAVEVARSNPASWHLVEGSSATLEPQQVRLRIDRFGLSTNNVTYAHFGDAMRYWDFFPATTDGSGLVPVWGFGEVVESAHDDVPLGTRLFGYYPMADELIITAGRVSERTIHDVSPHRASLPGAYNSFSRCAADPLYRVEDEDALMLLYPLFFTAWTIDDFLADHDDFGAAHIAITSASSKTSLAVAHLLAARGVPIIGITSAANIGFTEARGIYNSVVSYDDIETLALEPAVVVDVAGNPAVIRRIHEHYQSLLGHSMIVGATQFGSPDDGQGHLPGPRREFLFAPVQIDKRTGEWGSEELARRVAAAWFGFTPWADSWIDYRDCVGPTAIGETFAALVNGHVDPTIGYRCTMKEA